MRLYLAAQDGFGCGIFHRSTFGNEIFHSEVRNSDPGPLDSSITVSDYTNTRRRIDAAGHATEGIVQTRDKNQDRDNLPQLVNPTLLQEQEGGAPHEPVTGPARRQ
jgi:hypothetical protein